MQVDDILADQAAAAHAVVQALVACELQCNRSFTDSRHYKDNVTRLNAALADAKLKYTTGHLTPESKLTFMVFNTDGKVQQLLHMRGTLE